MPGVTILVDECRWPHRGRRWCHLVSDESYGELHAFARRLGIPRIAFQGDHYDLHEIGRERAVALGAVPVDSRRIVRALESSGLRRGPALGRRGLSGVTHLPAPRLHTERLVLRQWRADDVAAMAAIDGDADVMVFLGGARTPQQTAAAIDREAVGLALRGVGRFAVEHRGTGELLGRVGLGVALFDAPFTPAVEIGWRLSRRHRGQGFATEAALAALRHGFDALELDEIVAFTATANVGSRAVMDRLGMRRDPAGDFDHPGRSAGDPHRRSVLYRLRPGDMQA
jgi:ribosomal-protein-alanine N-acetyltransferase